MAQVAKLIMQVSYWLGLLGLVAGVVIRFVPSVTGGFGVSGRGAVIFAGTLFLCSIASHFAAEAVGKP